MSARFEKEGFNLAEVLDEVERVGAASVPFFHTILSLI